MESPLKRASPQALRCDRRECRSGFHVLRQDFSPPIRREIQYLSNKECFLAERAGFEKSPQRGRAFPIKAKNTLEKECFLAERAGFEKSPQRGRAFPIKAKNTLEKECFFSGEGGL
jgi:hypothetical protein